MPSNYKALLTRCASRRQEFEELLGRLQALELQEDIPLREFFAQTRETVMQAVHFNTLLEEDPALQNTPQPLLEELNKALYAPLHPETGYDTCLGNPDYAVRLYGQDFGGLASAIYLKARSLRNVLALGCYPEAVLQLQLWFTLYGKALAGNNTYQDWLDEYRAYELGDFEDRVAFWTHQRFDPEADHYRRLLQTSELGDTRYLYRFCAYVSEHDLAMAEYVNAYPEEELSAIAKFIVRSFVDGYVRGQKDYTKKKYANLIFPLGMERLGKMLLAELEAIGMEAVVSQPNSNGINRQVNYDHRFDRALTLDRDMVELTLKTTETLLEANKDILALQAGPVYVELFGETPFSPVAKSTALKLSPEQQALSREMNARNGQIYYKYYRRDESSFTIIAFPSPEIGERFEEIFADTLKINLLDSNLYARLQQYIIDVLDTADFVHVKGKPGNDTDIMVKMHALTDPEHQTNFENCVADVNIPVGEVFTSPVLDGTTGTLHVEDIYLGSLRYYNLRMHFQDGWVQDYSCTNFPDPAEGKKYIHENLLLPHETLPIGEFAIGTNTLAYQIARKHDILSLLPILIIEKMGPHFAIGDTCYSHEEDAPHPSFVNGKEMIAVDNEKSATRKEDPVNAYTQKHMDITLPYEMLASITAIRADGSRQDIIRDGRFVVPGTEELNIPLEEMEALVK